MGQPDATSAAESECMNTTTVWAPSQPVVPQAPWPRRRLLFAVLIPILLIPILAGAYWGIQYAYAAFSRHSANRQEQKKPLVKPGDGPNKNAPSATNPSR